MDSSYRKAFNQGYSDDFYQRYLERFRSLYGIDIPFRLAETPLFVPTALRDEIATSAKAILAQIATPEITEKMQPAIPDHLRVPGGEEWPHCVQIDFGICDDGKGGLCGKVVELQAFPSLYAFMTRQVDLLNDFFADWPGLEGEWTHFFDGMTRAEFVENFRAAIVADEDPENVVLVDINPPGQKTNVDFCATKELIGIDSVCLSKLRKEGRGLYYEKAGRKVPIRRIYNRVVFDELEGSDLELGFDYRDDLDVTWVPHPNWYWLWSKYTLPFLDHPAVPKTLFLHKLEELPADLSRYVLKPLFSFAGAGVKINVEKAHIDAIPEGECSTWVLQEKVHYAPALKMPTGEGVKAEMRVMFLRAPGQELPQLSMNLVRMSRGLMLGVDQNKDMTWVGGTVGIWRR